jgi:hypothetical protein
MDGLYIPALTTRVAEIKALGNLASPTKDLLYPLFRLQAWPNAKRLERSLENIVTAFPNRRAALDLALPAVDGGDSGIAARAHLASLHDPAAGFSTWRTFIADYSWATPVLQWSNDPSILSAEVNGLLELRRGLIVRVRKSAGWNLAQIASLHAVNFGNSPVLVVVDYEQISRGEDITLVASLLQGTLVAIRNLLPSATLSFAIIASSFPTDFSVIDPQHSKLEIRERALHVLLNGSPTLAAAGIEPIYGDHAAVYGTVKAPGFGGWPRVDYALPRHWVYHRRHKDIGFAAAAAAAVASEDWDDTNLCWGAQEIRRAAAGDCTGLGALAPWTAVRINMHLHRQALFDMGASGSIDENWQD